MSKAFAARSPSDCGSWWSVMAIASAIELGSLRLFVFRGQGYDHIFLACVSSGVCVRKNDRVAHDRKEFPQHSTQKPLTISGGAGMEHVGILWGTGGEPVGILWGTGGEPGLFFGEPGFGGCLAP